LVSGSRTSPIITSVGVSMNGSMKAVAGSGISSMSLSLIAAQPRMLDPSMPKPFFEAVQYPIRRSG
jgi:hypothetical protein